MTIYEVIYREPYEGQYTEGIFMDKDKAERLLELLINKESDEWCKSNYGIIETDLDYFEDKLNTLENENTI